MFFDYSRKAGPVADLAIERPDLSRAARARVSEAGRRPAVAIPDNPLYRDVLAHYNVVALP